MVALATVQHSNALIRTTLPNLVAVFVGATNGIGETSLREFARATSRPRVYFVGRSQEAGQRIAAECKSLNSDGEFTFIKADVSLMKEVDRVCEFVKEKEKTVNLLFQSQGTMVVGVQTSEDIHLPASLLLYSRTRFTLNLLPLLTAAPSLRRVVSVFCGTKEGALLDGDWQGRSIKTSQLIANRGHASSLLTLSMEALAQRAPSVSFVHAFPGPVKGGSARGTKGILWGAIRVMSAIMGPFVYIPLLETGERHLFLATSARFPAREGDKVGVKVQGGSDVAKGVDGEVGSGVYSVDQTGESANAEVVALLKNMKEEGLVEKVWEHAQAEFMRITGKPSI